MSKILNNDLTIVLLLKGRDNFTVRWFEYAKQFKLPYHVIIADGGSETDIEGILDKKQFQHSISYEYIRYPYDENYKFYFQKILNALSKVKTPYVLLASNDDFYFFNSIKSSVSFLKENVDYVSARGEIWDFSLSSPLRSENSTKKNEAHGKIQSLTKLYKHPSVLGECAMSRAIDFYSKNNSIWHDVVRTEYLKDSYAELVGSNINNLTLAESLVNFLLVTKGKIYRGSNLFMLHQCHENMEALTISYDPLDWINSQEWNAEFNNFLDLVGAQISNIDKINFYEAKYKLLKTYIDFILLRNISSYLLLKRNSQDNESTFIFLLKKLFKKNLTIFNLMKKINQSLHPTKNKYEIPIKFKSEIALIENFLKNRV
jgi:glycosyltransferase domain-containing protein